MSPSDCLSSTSLKLAVATVGKLPSMAPEPNFENRRKLHQKLCEKLETIPSTLSTSYGHRGMVEHPDLYNELGEQPWVYPTDPGSRPPYPTHRRLRKDEPEVVYENWAGHKVDLGLTN